MSARALIVSAAASGTGKTTLTAGLLRALQRRGVPVRPAKAGPDYIDPAFHTASAGLSGPNLDSWAMPGDLLDGLVAEAVAGVDLLLIEGAMGLFDGAPGLAGRRGAAADLAARYGMPVLLLLDASGQSQTAAAVAHGLATYDPAVRVAGVVLNRVASERHRLLIAEALARKGCRSSARCRATRRCRCHRGISAWCRRREHADLEARLDRLADAVERHVDLDAILAARMPLAISAAAAATGVCRRRATASRSPRCRLHLHLSACSRRLAAGRRGDRRLLAARRRGAARKLRQLLAARRLSRASCRRDSRPRAASGRAPRRSPRPGRSMASAAATWCSARRWRTRPGRAIRMAGLLGHVTSFARRRLTLGYREARLLSDSPIGRSGQIVRGHEFHYSSLVEAGSDAPLVALSDARGASIGPAGGRRGRVRTGTFFHAIAGEREPSRSKFSFVVPGALQREAMLRRPGTPRE